MLHPCYLNFFLSTWGNPSPISNWNVWMYCSELKQSVYDNRCKEKCTLTLNVQQTSTNTAPPRKVLLLKKICLFGRKYFKELSVIKLYSNHSEIICKYQLFVSIGIIFWQFVSVSSTCILGNINFFIYLLIKLYNY